MLALAHAWCGTVKAEQTYTTKKCSLKFADAVRMSVTKNMYVFLGYHYTHHSTCMQEYSEELIVKEMSFQQLQSESIHLL